MIYENDISRLYLVTYTTKFEKQPVTEQFFVEHSETSVNAFSEDFFVHTDTYTTLEEKLSQNENKEGFEKSMEYQTWRVRGFYPWNKIEELKNLHRLQISSSVILNSISSISPREVSKSRTIFLIKNKL